MTLVYNIIGGSDYMAKNNDDDSAHRPLSENVELIREEIKRFISKNNEKAVYANPVRYILKIDKDEITKGGDKESEPIVMLMGTNSETDKKINSELIEYMKKEIKSLKLRDDGEIEITVLNEKDIKGSDYGFNFEQMKEYTAYIISPININTFSFIRFIDLIGHYFENCCIIKCGLDDAYTERMVLYIGHRLTDSPTTSTLYIPTNERPFIDFMYSIYSRALFVSKSSDDEYKSFTNACVKLIRNVEMF